MYTIVRSMDGIVDAYSSYSYTNTFSEVESVSDRYFIISNPESHAILPSLYQPDKVFNV